MQFVHFSPIIQNACISLQVTDGWVDRQMDRYLMKIYRGFQHPTYNNKKTKCSWVQQRYTWTLPIINGDQLHQLLTHSWIKYCRWIKVVWMKVDLLANVSSEQAPWWRESVAVTSFVNGNNVVADQFDLTGKKTKQDCHFISQARK